MNFFTGSMLYLLILLLFASAAFCDWIKFEDYFQNYRTQADAANIIRARDNCDANMIQIIPGDCRPIY